MRMSKKEKKKNNPKSEYDVYAWIVLRLPRKLWTKGQMILEKLKETFQWNVTNGEIKFVNDKRSNKNLKGSNVVQIVHHALDDSTPEPDGYKTVFPYLLQGSTPPKNQRNKTKKPKPIKTLEKKKKLLPFRQGDTSKVVLTQPFVKDKFLWQVL